MLRYRTEIVIPADRYVCLQLPERFPEGRATIVVQVIDPVATEGSRGIEDDLDREDIEWWEEFDDTTEPVV